MMNLKYLVTSFLLLLFSASGFAQAERILSYDTQIEVHEDRSITVTEFIEVYAAGVEIKRGITRSLPSKRYLKDQLVSMSYKILEVEKDGQPESYRLESSGDQILYIGRRDVFLNPGTYRYKIKYKVPHQIAFFDDYDEIYWNAIGNDISFLVEKATASLRLPEGAEIIQKAAYVGRQGQQGQEFTVTEEQGFLLYDITRPLQPREGFTIAVGFEKGYVRPPGIIDRFGTLIVILLGLGFLIPYYISTWFKFGQDPPKPAVYPQWEVPDNLSAASTNYILNGRHQSKSFTASIIQLAIKGYLRIEEVVDEGFFKDKKYYALIRIKDSDDTLAREEKTLMDSLFMYNDRVSIDGKYDAKIESSFSNHKANLSVQHSDFINEGNNTRLLWLPILVTIAVGALAIVLLMRSAYAEGINFVMLGGFALVAIVGNILYGYLIRQPTIEKLDLRSRIRGFQMYLELTEEDRLNLLNPPDMTPEHFEKILPYAFSLGVEHKWSEKFKTILEKAQYQPNWHNGTNPVYFSSNFGRSFEKSVTGATTQPTQSGSGSGGGGFSGGGGGGGGVGGW